MENNTSELQFRISAGLKNIIGRDLISDKFIAIFELVKNSYDAQANNVIISFKTDINNKPVISIADDGFGMDYSDIINKWLFVAYSEKNIRNRKETNYREKIKRNVAGAKGVGRFSCDRLGAKLRLITKTKNEQQAHYVDINWNEFEIDDSRDFITIPVEYSQGPFPANTDSGAILEITELRESWDRDSIIKLKKSLMKLISPDFHNEDDQFSITIDAADEKEKDNKIKESKNYNERDIVNGKIKNDIFEKLNIKTTNISLDISKDGKTIETLLTDRNQKIFRFKEKNNKYSLLSNIHISLFYLNRAAKLNFTRLMGVAPTNYGSIFVYKNGFRINPYGEPNEDFFGINRRKAQGYNRYLGTRELMGRISISGENDGFIETSSRAHGFIHTESVEMLSDLFLNKVLKVLERYVVNVISWNNPIKSSKEVKPSEVADKIISEFAELSSRNDIIEIEYDESIITDSTNKDSDNISSALTKLQKVADKTQNKAVSDLVHTVKKQTDIIKQQNLELEEENRQTSIDLDRAKQSSKLKDKQIFFLKNAANNSPRNLLNGLHSVFTQSEAITGNIEMIESILKNDRIDINELSILLSEVKISNQKINKISRLAIHGVQNLKAEHNADVFAFIQQYLSKELTIKGLSYVFEAKDDNYNCYFDAASVGLIIDNVFSNSVKAKSSRMTIVFTNNAKSVEVGFYDNGIGLQNGLSPSMLFEYGATTTDNSKTKGFGIGLTHIRQLIEDMGGKVQYDSNYTNGFGLKVRFKK